MSLFKRLYIQVLLGILAGIVLGLTAPHLAAQMKPLGDGFISLLKIFLAPIIFFTVVHGMASVRDIRKLGRLGTKALVYFEVVSTLGLLLGNLIGNVFKPGVGLHVSPLSSSATTANIASVATAAGHFTFVNFLLSIIPTTIIDAFAKGEILQVLFISVLVGVALSQVVKPGSVIVAALAEGQTILFKMLSYVMYLAPLGAFGAFASAVATNGSSTLLYLARLIILFYAGCAVFTVFVLGGICMYAGVTLMKVIRLFKDEIMIVLGTAASDVVFPRIVQKLEQAGCDEVIVGFVLPAAYSFNLNGTAIYMALAVVFIAQAMDTPFSAAQQLAVLGVLLLTSKGGTSIAGGAFVKLAATLESIHQLPLTGLTFLFGIDRLMSTAIALTNVIGNAVAVLAIAKSEKAFNRDAFDRALQQPATAVAVHPVL